MPGYGMDTVGSNAAGRSDGLGAGRRSGGDAVSPLRDDHPAAGIARFPGCYRQADSDNLLGGAVEAGIVWSDRRHIAAGDGSSRPLGEVVYIDGSFTRHRLHLE